MLVVSEKRKEVREVEKCPSGIGAARGPVFKGPGDQRRNIEPRVNLSEVQNNLYLWECL